MDSEIAELEQRIARRTQIRDRKALCQKYLNISASIEKIEKLLAGAAEEMSGGTAEEALSRGSGELIEVRCQLRLALLGWSTGGVP